MATLILDCPHCPARSMTFTLVGSHGLWLGDRAVANTYYALMRCGGCGKCVIAELAHSSQQTPDTLTKCNRSIQSVGFDVADYWPKPAQPESPAHVPENLARFYMQAAEALSRGNWDAAGMMARKVLDAATFKIDPSLDRGLKLYARIEKLASDHKITPALQEWAHVIRVDGNDAAHEPEEFEESEAKQICEFTHTFLEYTFTMPGKLAARKANAGTPANTPLSAGGGATGSTKTVWTPQPALPRQG